MKPDFRAGPSPQRALSLRGNFPGWKTARRRGASPAGARPGVQQPSFCESRRVSCAPACRRRPLLLATVGAWFRSQARRVEGEGDEPLDPAEIWSCPRAESDTHPGRATPTPPGELFRRFKRLHRALTCPSIALQQGRLAQVPWEKLSIFAPTGGSPDFAPRFFALTRAPAVGAQPRTNIHYAPCAKKCKIPRGELPFTAKFWSKMPTDVLHAVSLVPSHP